jgi:hypothetical protein
MSNGVARLDMSDHGFDVCERESVALFALHGDKYIPVGEFVVRGPPC